MLIYDYERILAENRSGKSDLEVKFGVTLLQISIHQFNASAAAAARQGDYVTSRWWREQRELAISALSEERQAAAKRSLLYRLRQFLHM